MRFFLAVLFFLIAFQPARAAELSKRERSAVQLLRLHSDLMVIALTCKQGSTGRDLRRTYANFTQRYVKQLQWAEAVVSAYYEDQEGKDGQKALDALRTKLANEVGEQISAASSTQRFCNAKRDYVTYLYDSPPARVRAALKRYGDVP